VATFADRSCHVVRVADPYGGILGFLDRDLISTQRGNTGKQKRFGWKEGGI
jgi:hypothetical protein